MPKCINPRRYKINLFNTNLRKFRVQSHPVCNLNEYVDFRRWQRSQGIRCLCSLQQADVQNNPVYKARPDPDNMNAGAPDFNVNSEEANKLLDATRDDPPYNTNSFPAYDPDNQYIGIDTPLDKMFNASDGEVSVNAMDTTWGGEDYANNLFKETTK